MTSSTSAKGDSAMTEQDQAAHDASTLSNAPRLGVDGGPAGDEPVVAKGVVRPGDRIFRTVSVGAASLVTASIIAIAVASVATGAAIVAAINYFAS